MPRLGDRRFAVLAAIGTAAAYCLGAQLGMAFTPPGDPVSILWPPNAILLGAFLCTPTAAWPLLLLAVLPAHLVVEIHGGVPAGMALSWFVSNSFQALLGAVCIRRLIPAPVRFDSFRRVLVFVAFGAVLSPFLASFLDIALIRLNALTLGVDYWNLWRERFFSNVLGVLTIVPVIVPWDLDVLASIRRSSAARRIEVAGLAGTVAAIFVVAFTWHPSAALATPLLLGVVLSCVLWAAVRFGPRGSSICLFTLNILALVWVADGHEPFIGLDLREKVLALQLVMMGIYIPILALAGVIRERARREREIQGTMEWLTTVLGAAQMGTWSLDLATKTMNLSERSRQLLGLAGPASNVDGYLVVPQIALDDHEQNVSARPAVQQPPPYEAEFPVSRGDGQTSWVLSRGRFVDDGSGHFTRMVGVHTDITARKLAETGLHDQIEARVRAERALRASEERCAKAFQAIPDAISVTRQSDGRIVEVNERWSAMFGFTAEEAAGRTLVELGIETEGEEDENFRSLLVSQGYVRDFERNVSRRCGAVLRAVVACDTVEVGGEACLITMMRDVTERRLAEREIETQRLQLAHLGRVALVGELSCAVAHELNQPLAAILANTRAAQRMLARDDFDREEMRLILDDVATDDRRAGDVIRRFRALLRKGDSEPQQLVMNDLVEEVLGLAHSDIIQRGTTVTTRLLPSLPSIAGDRVQLQQLILNLLMNACDATSANSPFERRVVIATEDAGSAVRLSVSDCGTGIAVRPIESVFEPFVTSKQNGLGLGLAICRSIVDAHGGRIWAENHPGCGATFHLLLPRTQFVLYVPPLARLPEQFRAPATLFD